MYFPFLYGRRSEFLALRAMLSDHRHLGALVPIVEPVKRNIADLARCIEHFGEADQALAVILNPDKFELRSTSSAEGWRKEILPVIGAYDSVVPTFRCISTSTLSQVRAFLKAFEGRAVAIAYSSPSLADSDVAALASNAQVRFHVVLNGKMAAAQQDLLHPAKRIDVRDYFNKLDRNSDYGGDELFTDRIKTYKPAWAGFGDYAAIGSAFTPGGGQPAAVAIHAIYKHASGDLWIEHFVSDDTDMDAGSTEGKFLQAASKLVLATKSRSKEFGTNFALEEFAAHVSAHHYPGLGTNKVLQIDHHICLMLDTLSGAV